MQFGDKKHWQFVIIGGGPAGLQLGHFFHETKDDYLILEQSERVGAFYEEFPRHEQLISINKVATGCDDSEKNLRWDWNSLLAANNSRHIPFGAFTAEYFPNRSDMVRYLNFFADQNQLNVALGTQVQQIRRADRAACFEIDLASDGTITAENLIIATGLSQPYVPEIEGIEHAIPYTKMPLKKAHYFNQRVLIIGKGNSAFETADHLTPSASMIHLCSPHPVRMAWESHYVGHLRAVNCRLIDTYHLKSQNALLDATISRIERNGSSFLVTFEYAHAEGEVESIEYDHILLCAGFRFDANLFHPNHFPELAHNNRFPALTEYWESVNIPNLYFAGSLMQSRDYKRAMSGFIHGFRYNVRTLYHLLRERVDNVAYPNERYSLSIEALVGRMLERMNRSSGLWQQPSFLCDAFLIEEHTFAHQEELTHDLCQARLCKNGHGRYLTLSLEYGTHANANPLSIARIARTNTDSADRSTFLHPVVRLFDGHELLATHHVIEDLFGEWCDEEHTVPLSRFLTKILRQPAQAMR